MKFGDDWRGIFLRGDSAAGYAIALRSALSRLALAPSEWCLENLAELLESADERRAPWTVTEAPLAAPPPRPWHYVTEKLPEPGQRVIFWIRGGIAGMAKRFLAGTYRPVDTSTDDLEQGDEWYSDSGGWWRTPQGQHLNFEVFAWQPEPEPPPLPEAPTAADLIKADYLAGDPALREMVANHPVLGAMQADLEAAEAATISGDGNAGSPRGTRTPVDHDPDLLQALKDAARMERKR